MPAAHCVQRIAPRRKAAGFRAPIARPTSASAAKAKPSSAWEVIMMNCIST